MEKPLKIRLHVLSPIHIGCDDVYEPTSFVIDTDKKKLISFDPLNFIKNLNEKEKKEFSNITNKGNLSSIIELYRFIYKHNSKIKGKEVDIVQEVIDRYLKVKGMPLDEKKIRQELNSFILPRTAYNSYTNQAYIPGSSLKGSLRTGYLSMLAFSVGTAQGIKDILEGKNPVNSITGKKNAKELEKELLHGSFSDDPFRMLKISDMLPVKDVKTKIIYGVNRKKDSAMAAKGIPTIFEVINSGAVFEGYMNIEKPIENSGIKELIIPEILFLLTHKHYARIYNNEFKISKSRGFSMPMLNNFNDALKKTAFLVRLGRHSGAEAVTIEGNRQITIRGPRGSKVIKDHATTIWLASETSKPENNHGLIPFGWAVMEVVKE
jgi:CRISPR-associated protein Csm5